MTFAMFVASMLVGLGVGGVAGAFMRRGGYGLGADIVLGLAGSAGLSWLVPMVGLFPEAGLVGMTAIALAGAVLPIVVQRRGWPTDLDEIQPSRGRAGRGSSTSLSPPARLK